MALNARFHTVVVGKNLTAKRMVGTDNALHSVIATGTDVIEIRITLADYSLPDKKLCSICMCEFIGIVGVLRSPGSGDIPLIAILHDSTEQKFDLFRLNRVVVLAGIVVPELFAEPGIGIADVSCYTGFDAVADLSVKGIHTVKGCEITGLGFPAVHVGFGGVAPAIRAVGGVCITVTRVGNHIRFRRFGGSKCIRAHAEHCCKAHQDCKQSRHATSENFLFHIGIIPP